MRTALLIARKDLRQRLRDRSALLWGIVAPLVLSVVFSFVFNPISQEDFHADFVVVDEDGGPIAQAFRQAFTGMEAAGVVTVRDAASEAEARKLVEVGSDAFAEEGAARADAAFVIPAGFSQTVLAGDGGSLTVMGAKGSELGSQVAYSVAKGFAAELDAVTVAVKTALPPDYEPTAQEAGTLAQEAAATVNPISIADISAATRQLDATTQMTAGMAVFFLFFSIQFGVAGLLEERRLGTMPRLLAAPLRRRDLIVGKAIGSFVLGLVSMVVLVVATTLLLGADWGHPLGVAALIVAGVFSAMGILAIVAAVARTQEQAANAGAVIAMVLGLLGGTFFPVSRVGGLLSRLTYITPHAWFMRGLGDLAGGGVAAVWPSVIALLAFGLVAGSVAWVFLVRAMGR